MKSLYIITFLSAVIASALNAHTFESARVDAHAPISIMGDHVHAQGEWMLSYRYMQMSMDGIRNGTDSVSPADIFAANYTVTPVEMTMDMQMLGAMYAPTDQLTLMLMANYLNTEMDHQIFPMAAPLINLNGGSQTFTTASEGWGDMIITGLYQFWKTDNQRLHFGLGFSLPTGSIDEQDIIPGPGGRIDRQMPAPMQLGSGTYDFIPSLTYVQQFESSSWGLQARSTLRLGENDNNYTLGNRYSLEGWYAYKFVDNISVSLGLKWETIGELDGDQSNVALNPPFAPSRRTVNTAFGENYGGNILDASIGINYLFTDGILTGHRLAADIRLPLNRDLNGFQLETDYIFTLGWQKAF